MRHMSQKSVPLLCKVHQTSAQPLQLSAEALQIERAPNFDRVRERSAPKLADGAIKLPQRPADGEGQPENRDQYDRQQQRRLQKKSASGALGLRFEGCDLRVDLCVALGSRALGECAHVSKALQQIRN